MIFYIYGLGYFGALLPSDLVLMSILIFGVNVISSIVYLKFRSTGPFEYLWRKMVCIFEQD